jgi:hypothetical protein
MKENTKTVKNLEVLHKCNHTGFFLVTPPLTEGAIVDL